MHEYSLAQELVQVIRRALPPGSMRRVKAVKLRLGELSVVTPGSLAVSFVQASAGTVAEGARLDVETVAGDDLRVVALELADDGGQGT